MTANDPALMTTAYERVCDSCQAFDDFRTKLLGLLPTATGTGVFLLLSGESDLLDSHKCGGPLGAIGAVGFLFTLGLFAYELYGIKKCYCLIETGKRLGIRIRYCRSVQYEPLLRRRDGAGPPDVFSRDEHSRRGRSAQPRGLSGRNAGRGGELHQRGRLHHRPDDQRRGRHRALGRSGTPDGRHFYTANVDDGTMAVVDASSGAETARIAAGSSPTSVAVTPDGGPVFVTNFGDGTVRVLEGSVNP
jgi:YVTN family beta-propeller protein